MADASYPRFRNVLELGSTGTQPVAVKRGLYRAHFTTGWDDLDGPEVSVREFGELAVANLERFQKSKRLTADGVYGPATHRLLVPSFDDYAVALYTKPVIRKGVQLPSTFRATHETEGLPGYPAIDVFGAPGQDALSPEAGKITRFSGHDPREGGEPSKAYGWSIYLTCPHAIYFLTHFATRAVAVGETVARGDVLGTICDAAVAHMATDLSHIHVGKHVL